MICDRCNRPYHTRCTNLRVPPTTYWYCTECAAHIRARGYVCPTEDLAFQRYLLTNNAAPTLLPHFRRLAQEYTFSDVLYAWRDHRWLPFPSRGA